MQAYTINGSALMIITHCVMLYGSCTFFYCVDKSQSPMGENTLLNYIIMALFRNLFVLFVVSNNSTDLPQSLQYIPWTVLYV